MLRFGDKDAVLKKSVQWWNPGKTRQWQKDGIDLVIGKREGYYLYDMNGKQLMDLHLNGGTFNLGHRNPEIISTLKNALDEFDIGNHHFPAITRAQLAEELGGCTPNSLKYSIFSSGGGEAIDVALKCARYATKRKKIVSVKFAYHGHTGLAVSLGNERYSRPFLGEGAPGEFIHVPFNDVQAMEAALSREDVACVIMETIPATYGFPLPEKGYLYAVKQLCEKYGSLYIADEVQTGLLRTGKLWGIEHYGVEPDILVTAKGFGGGIYPIAATIVSERAGQWMNEDGFAHISTFGGSELGCIVAMKVLEISQRKEVIENVDFVSRYLRAGLETIKKQNADFFVGIRQLGVVMGLEFAQPEGAKHVMRALYNNGVWAIYSMLDTKVLQFKPGLLCDQNYCDELLSRCELSIRQAARALV
ncbi:aminotransferase class III-fold pyridoxal phosphate-dependent enzyme [Brevibacillus agri]|uniref:class-III pyridoxal-phosphate-dependent aminotransferase n=1 Tax=Brevibacillus agri TaxID=51101 RepID=UPI0025B6CBBA|nr:aminotransferase class III-fold pyridoxal phosphate-dependent enzyme [Brevibacillus agri]MDN4094976.1 aminotransferase class III-fold pyridoxal phosphate-dependent enzyme [Brevibacillus agri]MED3501714.1 aminotransferase class III-fold pyridoxal phosphate-dependent enzyme [Brevibacillus agri]